MHERGTLSKLCWAPTCAVRVGTVDAVFKAGGQVRTAMAWVKVVGVFFGHSGIVKEKDVASYRKLVVDQRMDPAKAWMVGNSPKSDITPALEAGIGAVYVPHPRTWHLEREPVQDGHHRLLIVKNFADLANHF